MYANTRFTSLPWHSELPPKELVKSVALVNKGYALDVCCGAGTNSIYLAASGFIVKGIDVSASAIKIARRRAAKSGLEIDFEVGDVLSLDDVSSYDFVFDRGCFHHISDSEKPEFVRKIHRAIKPGGHFHLMAFSGKNNYEKSLTKKDIINYFGGLFRVGKISEAVHTEPDGKKVYLHSVLMKKIIPL